MKQLGYIRSHNESIFANARHHLFKRIQHWVFESSIYVGINILVVSLWRVPYLPPLFVLFHCWTRNLIASVSDLVGTLTHQLCTYLLCCWAVTDGNSHSFVICCEKWSTCSSSKTVDIMKIRAKVLAQQAFNINVLLCTTPSHCARHCFLYPLWLHFCNDFNIMWNDVHFLYPWLPHIHACY